MRKIYTFFLAVVLTSLAGCGSKMDASERNFEAALKAHFDKYGLQCLRVSLPLNPQPYQRHLEEEKWKALEAVGLLKREEIEFERETLVGNRKYKMKVDKYTVASAARQQANFIKRRSDAGEAALSEQKIAFCWGTKKLVKVVKWVGPMKLGDYQEASVEYEFRLLNFSEWANRPEVRRAFREVRDQVGVGNRATMGVLLTSNGWEAKPDYR